MQPCPRCGTPPTAPATCCAQCGFTPGLPLLTWLGVIVLVPFMIVCGLGGTCAIVGTLNVGVVSLLLAAVLFAITWLSGRGTLALLKLIGQRHLNVEQKRIFAVYAMFLVALTLVVCVDSDFSMGPLLREVMLKLPGSTAGSFPGWLIYTIAATVLAALLGKQAGRKR